MIDDYKTWFKELERHAIERKQNNAKKKGDVSLWKKERWRNPIKNKEIKKKFTEKGKMLGFNPRSSYDRKAREWLYDLIWREFDVDGNFLSVKLTIEIELSRHDEKHIRYDFNKLLQADSEYKVLVFQQKTEKQSHDLLTSFEKSAYKYNSRVSSKYLLCCWCTKKNEFKFNDFCISV